MTKDIVSSELRNMSNIEKLGIIEIIETSESITDEEMKMLDLLSRDKDGEIRAMIAGVLALICDSRSEEILVRLINDKEELVRVNACDSLSFSRSLEVINLLKDRIMKDKSSLVRGYASLSVADIGNRINLNSNELIDFFKNVLKRERVNWVKINIYKALYTIGDESSLGQLLNGLNSRLYRNRSVTISCLTDIVNAENCSIIKSSLIKQLQFEKAFAVKNKIENFLQNINMTGDNLK